MTSPSTPTRSRPRSPAARSMPSIPAPRCRWCDYLDSVMQEGAFTGRGTLVNSGEYSGLDFDAAFDALARHFEADGRGARRRSEEHTSELQSLMRSSYAVFCLKTKTLHFPAPL